MSRLDIDINDNNPHLSSRSNLSTAGLTTQSSNSNNTVNNLINTGSSNNNGNGNGQSQSKSNGIGHKVIAGLMVPSSTAQSYAAIAHAAAAAAQSNQQRNNNHQFVGASLHPEQGGNGNFGNHNSMIFASNGPTSNSNNNINTNNNNPNKQQSYNNPSFFESTSYPIVIKLNALIYFALFYFI